MLGDLLRLTNIFGNDGCRRLKLGAPGSIHYTYDEASILSALSASQSGDMKLCEAHLTWLMARTPEQELLKTISTLSSAFSGKELILYAPEVRQAASSSPRRSRSLNEIMAIGRA